MPEVPDPTPPRKSGIPFHTLSNELRMTLTPLELAVYSAFKSFADIKTGITKVSVETIAKGPGLSRKSVEKALRLLVAKGYIVAKSRGRKETSLRKLFDSPQSDTPKLGVQKESNTMRGETVAPERADSRVSIGLIRLFKPGGIFAFYGPPPPIRSNGLAEFIGQSE